MLLIYLRGRETGGSWSGEREINPHIHPFTYSANPCSGQYWARLKPASRNSIQVCGWVAGTKLLEPLSAASQDLLLGRKMEAGIGSQSQGSNLGTQMQDMSVLTAR